MKFNFEAQWLAAVTMEELMLLKYSVASKISSLDEHWKDEMPESIIDYQRRLSKLLRELEKMIEIATTAPIEVL